MKPRDYQEYGINEIFRYFMEGNTGNPVIAMPTGTGKSIVIAEFIRRAMSQYKGQRIMMLTHVKELIEQNYDKLLKLWPMAPVGIYSAGLGRKETNYPITFGGVASVYRAAHHFGHIDLVFVDECHLIPRNSNTMYRKTLALLKKVNPNLKVIGLTATPYRVGMGLITDEGGLFDDICCDMTVMEAFNWFFDQGYLTMLTPKKTEVEIDVSKVGRQQGDFNSKQLQKVSDQERITREAVQEMIWYGENDDRKHWLIFTTGVEHVNHIVEELKAQGVSAAAVHSKMSNDERDANIKAFLNKEITALVNMGVLTTGFDAPFIDMLGILRATESPGLWVQILGRGTRPYYAEGYDLTTQQGRLDAIQYGEKPDCLVLDFAGNTKRLGPINDPRIPEAKKKGGGEAPVRECDGYNKEKDRACNMYIHASLRFCPHCGKEFPPEIKFQAKASDEELVKRKGKSKPDPVVEEFKVDFVTYVAKASAKGPLLMVTYQCGLRKFSQPLCLEHEGWAKKKSRDWWRKATNEEDNVPENTSEAQARFGEVRTPKWIRVWTNRKPYPDILHVEYDEELSNA
ncbi:MAG: putative ATP-dependent DNA helicase [Prokaryotic dsDNA virus sp.]|nr:MAG: putative ATP-dependent DNA helicase [Prokaryotic dsDNA virus sp.]|tara:strand:+ start:21701 stop:23410 length:1710 start_codon:yes stop_codon:yes gene_type:complete